MSNQFKNPSATNAPDAQSRANILVIEDHDIMRLLIGKALKQDADIVTKRDGFEAMAWLSGGNLPDLILLDMEMPNLDGSDFLTQIKMSGVFSEIPVLMVSATEDLDAIIRAFRMGIWAFMPKPFDPTELKSKVKDILGKTKFVNAA
jgi:CheY-like chemotaxis protein